MILKYIGAIAISSMFLFPAKKNIAQTIPYDTTSITNLLEKKEEGLSDVYEDPSFEAKMSIDAKLDKDLFDSQEKLQKFLWEVHTLLKKQMVQQFLTYLKKSPMT